MQMSRKISVRYQQLGLRCMAKWLNNSAVIVKPKGWTMDWEKVAPSSSVQHLMRRKKGPRKPKKSRLVECTLCGYTVLGCTITLEWVRSARSASRQMTSCRLTSGSRFDRDCSISRWGEHRISCSVAVV